MDRIHFSSRSDEWGTPREFFDELNAIHRFELDVCATRTNAKCPRYFTSGTNGLSNRWLGRCFMNPPYGRGIGAWIKKAYDEVTNGNAERVVCLLPARTDTAWMHRYIFPFTGGALIGPSTDFAWAAGIVDGEGCIHIRKNEPSSSSKHKSTHFALVLKVTMTDATTIHRLRELFRVGHITVDANKPSGHKTAHSWTCMSADAQGVLRKLYPYLLTKRHEAFRAIEFGFLGSARRGHSLTSETIIKARRHFYEELRSLKTGHKSFVAPWVDINFIKGRIKFEGAKYGAPFPSAVVVFKGRP